MGVDLVREEESANESWEKKTLKDDNGTGHSSEDDNGTPATFPSSRITLKLRPRALIKLAQPSDAAQKVRLCDDTRSIARPGN